MIRLNSSTHSAEGVEPAAGDPLFEYGIAIESALIHHIAQLRSQPTRWVVRQWDGSTGLIARFIIRVVRLNKSSHCGAKAGVGNLGSLGCDQARLEDWF